MVRIVVILSLLLSLPATLVGDVPPPAGRKRVSREYIIEVGDEARNYRFWLRSLTDKLEPLPLIPGEPYRIHMHPNERQGIGSIADIVAVPQALAKELGEDKLHQALRNRELTPGFLRTAESLDFYGDSLSTYDGRDSIVARYQLVIRAGKPLELVFLDDNSDEAYRHWWHRGLIVVGVLICALSIWIGYRFLRRKQMIASVPG